jgi:hypothetical protein
MQPPNASTLQIHTTTKLVTALADLDEISSLAWVYRRGAYSRSAMVVNESVTRVDLS